jgi:hypothetical protein
MLAVFVTFEAAAFAVALAVLGWSLPFVILVAIVVHVVALVALLAIATAKDRTRSGPHSKSGRVAQAGGALSPLPPRDA